MMRAVNFYTHNTASIHLRVEGKMYISIVNSSHRLRARELTFYIHLIFLFVELLLHAEHYLSCHHSAISCCSPTVLAVSDKLFCGSWKHFMLKMQLERKTRIVAENAASCSLYYEHVSFCHAITTKYTTAALSVIRVHNGLN